MEDARVIPYAPFSCRFLEWQQKKQEMVHNLAFVLIKGKQVNLSPNYLVSKSNQAIRITCGSNLLKDIVTLTFP